MFKVDSVYQGTCKVILLRQAIQAEHEASNIYDMMADYFDEIGYKKGKRIMQDVSDEEEIHVGEFTSLIEEVNDKYSGNIAEGKKEVKNI